MSKKKHIALVTTWFPPQQSVATNRMLAFVEFLSENYSIEVFALADVEESKEWTKDVKVHYFKGKSLVDKLRSNQSDSRLKHLLKTGLKVVLRKISKDPLQSWQKKVTVGLTQVHANQPFDLVISSFAPQESHLAVIEFLKGSNSIPWIADMRDEMSMNPGLNVSAKHRLREVELEINKYAKAITSVSKPIVDDFRKLCPDIKQFLEVRNGFNHNLVNDFQHKNEVFTIGYFGSFYGGRKPVVFFEAIEQLVNEQPEFIFEFHIVGAHRNFDIPSSVSQFVKFLPPLNYSDAIQKMMQMDVNLVLHPRSGQKGVFTGKLFDYLSVNVPVLACVDADDVAAELVRELEIGYIAECTDLEQNKRAILNAFSDWKSGKIKRLSEEQRIQQHRKTQVAKLSKLIIELTEESSN